MSSTNRRAHLPLDVGKVEKSDWMLERSRNQVGMSIGWGYSNKGDKWHFLAAIIVHRTAVTTVAKYDQCVSIYWGVPLLVTSITAYKLPS